MFAETYSKFDIYRLQNVTANFEAAFWMVINPLNICSAPSKQHCTFATAILMVSCKSVLYSSPSNRRCKCEVAIRKWTAPFSATIKSTLQHLQ